MNEALPYGHFFLPGPTEVHPDVLAAQTRPMIWHRGQEMTDIMRPIQEVLQRLFGTEQPVMVGTCSGTGMMEAAVRNGSRESVLALVNGAFSERFAQIAEQCGRRVTRLEVPWGEVHDPAAVREALAAGSYDAVTVVHSETSTGALQPIADIAAVVGEVPDTLILVDSISGVGGTPMAADTWGLDFVLTGGQKALGLPPGLAFGVASQRLMERAETLGGRGMYFDLHRFAENHEGKLWSPVTPALSVIYALSVQAERIREETVEGRWDRHLEMARTCWAWVDRMREEHGLEMSVVADRDHRSPTVSCVLVPGGWTGPILQAAMRERGWVVATGYGRLREPGIRIGHMADHTVDELERLLSEIEEVLVS